MCCHVLPTGGAVDADIVDVQRAVRAQVVGRNRLLEDAERVAKDFVVVIHRDVHRSGVVSEDGVQFLVRILRGPGDEQVRADVRMDFQHLVQKVQDLRGVFVLRFADGQAHIICSILSGRCRSRRDIL